MGSFWGHFKIMLGSIRDHLEVISGSFWGHLGITLGSSWDHFGVILGSLWGHFYEFDFFSNKLLKHFVKKNLSSKLVVVVRVMFF